MLKQSVNFTRIGMVILALLMSGCSMFQKKAPVVQDTQAADTTVAPIPAELEQKFSEALALMQEEKFSEAEVILADITARYPDFAGPWTNYGIALFHNKKTDESLAALEKAEAIDNTFCSLYSVRGVVLRSEGQFVPSKEAYEQALACNPQDTNTLYNLGVLLDMYMHDERTALGYYRQYVEATGAEGKPINGWIVDLQRRVGPEETVASPEQVPAPQDVSEPAQVSETPVAEQQVAGES